MLAILIESSCKSLFLLEARKHGIIASGTKISDKTILNIVLHFPTTEQHQGLTPNTFDYNVKSNNHDIFTFNNKY